MPAIERSEIIPSIQSGYLPEPSAESKYPINETALCVIKILGLILLGAGIISLVTGLQIPPIALIVIGAASLFFGFSLIIEAPEEQETETPEVIAHSAAPATHDSAATNKYESMKAEALMEAIREVPQPSVQGDLDSLKLRIIGAANGPLLGDAWMSVPPSSLSLDSNVARAVAQALERQKEQPDQQLESLFAKELCKLINVDLEKIPEGMIQGESVGISVVGAIYYSDLSVVVEKSILFARATTTDIPSISAIVALSVALALLLRGHSIREAGTHSYRIAADFLGGELTMCEFSDRVKERESDANSDKHCANLMALIRGKEVPHPTHLNSSQAVSLGAAFKALQGLNNNAPRTANSLRNIVTDNAQSAGGNFCAHAVAIGALLGAYVGGNVFEESIESLDASSRKIMQEHSDRVLRLSGVIS